MKDRFNIALHGLGSTFPSPDPNRREEFLRSLQEKEERDRAAAALLRARKRPFWYALPAVAAAAVMLTVGIRAYQNNPPHSIPSVPVETTTTAALLPANSSETITEAVTEAVTELLTTEATSVRPQTATETTGIAQPVTSQPSRTQERPVQTQPGSAAVTASTGITAPRETTRHSVSTTVKQTTAAVHTTRKASGTQSNGGNAQPDNPASTTKAATATTKTATATTKTTTATTKATTTTTKTTTATTKATTVTTKATTVTTKATTVTTKATTATTKATSATTKATTTSTKAADASTKATTATPKATTVFTRPETAPLYTTTMIVPAQTTVATFQTTDFVYFTTTTPWYMHIHSTAVYTTVCTYTTACYAATETESPTYYNEPTESYTVKESRPPEDPIMGGSETSDSETTQPDMDVPIGVETEPQQDKSTYTIAAINPSYKVWSPSAPVWYDYEDMYPIGNGHSSEVIYGTVMYTYSFIGDDGLPYTAIEVNVENVLRGSCTGGELTVIEPGGYIPLQVLGSIDPDIRQRIENMTNEERDNTPCVREKACELPEAQTGNSYVFRLTEKQPGGWYCYSDRYNLSRLYYRNDEFYTYDGFRLTYDMALT